MANDLDEQAQRLKALWKSGRDKYQSFFAVLDEVRKQVGDDDLANWCFDHLRIGMSVIVQTTKVLTETDEGAMKASLRRAESLNKQLDRARARIADLEAQLGAAVSNGAAAVRIRELEAQVAALTAANAETSQRPAPKRDRRDYMREFMRRKRAADR